MKALIHNDKIVQIAETDFPVAPAMSWVDCPEEATTSWKYENGQVLPPDPEPEPTAEQILADFTAKIQNHLDEIPKERGYLLGIVGLISYETDPDPLWSAEATAGKLWRNAVHKMAHQIKNEIIDGTRPIPTWEELKAELPEIEWPEQ